MEGKEREEEIVADNLLDLAVNFTNSKQFTSAIDEFISNKSHHFEGSCDSKYGEIEELPHSYKEIFEEYQKLIDNLFEDFADRHGFAISAVYGCFRDSGTE